MGRLTPEDLGFLFRVHVLSGQNSSYLRLNTALVTQLSRLFRQIFAIDGYSKVRSFMNGDESDRQKGPS
jgi:hypothetical protein